MTLQGLFQDFAQRGGGGGGANAKYKNKRGQIQTTYIRFAKDPKGGKMNPRGAKALSGTS